MAKINNKCNSNSFYKNLIYIDILCNNCIFLVFCFYILYIIPFIRRHGQPDGITGARHADKLFCRDIGCNNRSPYCPPSQASAG